MKKMLKCVHFDKTFPVFVKGVAQYGFCVSMCLLNFHHTLILQRSFTVLMLWLWFHCQFKIISASLLINSLTPGDTVMILVKIGSGDGL